MTGAPADDEARRELARWATVRLDEALELTMGDAGRATGSRPRDGSGWFDVSGHDLTTPCPARWSVGGDDFVMTARTVAGALGRLALRERREGEPPGVAVDRVAGDLFAVEPDAFYLDWYEGLDRSGRAAVQAAATTWAVGALAAVRGRSLRWQPVRRSWNVPGRAMRLRGGCDALDRVARPEVLVAITNRALADPSLEVRAGFEALVDGVSRRQMVDRVRMGSAAAAGTRAYPVTEQLLEAAVVRVAELAAYRAVPAAAPTVPGQWCRDCPQLEICPEGTARVAPA
ncbi:MAG: hypothetical protein ACOYOP_12050 [Microthrixaceae bacterium]